MGDHRQEALFSLKLRVMGRSYSFIYPWLVSLAVGLLGARAMALPVINEIMANNQSTLADPQGDFDDWVEIYNPSAEPLDLGGYYFSDDPEDLTKWQIPRNAGVVIAAGGYGGLWLDHESEDGPDHVGLRLAAEGDELILTAPDGSSVLDRVSLPPQHPDISYGRDEGTGELRYLINPTPGRVNDPRGVTLLEGVNFSQEAGTFEGEFELILGTSSAGATIRFTLDGSRPSGAGTLTYEGPLSVSATACVRAALFLEGRQISPVESRVYLKVDASLRGFDSNLPIILLDSQGYDFANDDDPRTDYPAQPVCAGVFEREEGGRASVMGVPHFTGRAGMNVRGASSKTYPKKQFKFETWDEDDEDRDVSLLGMPAESDWLLQAPYFDKTLMRNEFIFHWWRALGYYSPRTRYVEVFLNPNPGEPFSLSHYQGVYLLTEKIKRSRERVDLTRLDEGDEAEPEITGGYLVQATNLNEDWVGEEGTRYKYVDPGGEGLLSVQQGWLQDYIDAAEASVYTPNFADPEEGYAKYLDVSSQIDYDIMRELSRNTDGASTFFSIDRGGKVTMGPLWDYNQALGLSSLGTAELGFGYETFGWNQFYMRAGHWLAWWNELDDDPSYQRAWNDRWVALRESTFTTEQLLGKIDADASLLEEAQVRNFEKWDILGRAVYVVNGRTRADPGDLDRDRYDKEVSFLRDWVEGRVAWIDSQVPSPPDFSRNGGAVPQAYPLVMSTGTSFAPFAGDIFYTTDGSDPALLGESAQIYSQPLSLTAQVRVKARTRNRVDGSWGALRDATFVVGTEPPTSLNLVISEIHYNPRGSDDLEFLELINRGESAVNLTGLRLAEAVDFEFPALELAPGGAVVVVEDEEAFAAEFSTMGAPRFTQGLVIAGQWTGRLGNGGEKIELIDAEGTLLHGVTYEEAGSWPSEADGEGFSLQLRELASDPALAENWDLSVLENGSPGLSGSQVLMTFTQWLERHFTAGEREQAQLSGPDADPDGDGFSNLTEYGLASLPRAAASQPQIASAVEELEQEAGRYLTLTFRRPVGSELQYGLETSPDLRAWESHPLRRVRGSVNFQTQTETITVRAPHPIESGHEGQRQLLRIYFSK